MCQDGQIRACAIKLVDYSSDFSQSNVNNELAGLRAVLGMPQLVQCLAVFKVMGQQGAALAIVLE